MTPTLTNRFWLCIRRYSVYVPVVALLFTLIMTGVTGWSVLNGSLFSDLSAGHPHAQAIAGLQLRGVINGYPDGTVKPDREVQRAEFLHIVIQAAGLTAQADQCLSGFRAAYGPSVQFLSDVPAGAWFEKDFCIAATLGIVKGYDDHTVRPTQTVTFSEGAAMLTRTLQLPVSADAAVWYKPSVDALAARSAIPTDVQQFDAPLNRGQVAEIVWRLTIPVTDRPSLTYDLIQSGGAVHAAANDLQTETLRIVNEKRAALGLAPYRANSLLQIAAQLHAEDMQRLGYFSHESQDGRTSEDRIRASGYLSIDLKTCNCTRWNYRWGEVISDQGKTPSEVIELFMGSPVHRAILTSTEFDEAGVGRIGEYWVIDTGRIIYR